MGRRFHAKEAGVNQMKPNLSGHFDIVQVQDRLSGQVGENQSGDKKFWRAKVELPEMDLLDWLGGMRLYPKFYWSDRQSQNVYATAGSVFQFSAQNWPGYAKLFSDIQMILDKSHPELRLFGGLRFNPGSQNSPEWQLFGNYKFFIPALEIFQTPQQQILTYNYSPQKNIQERQRMLGLVLTNWNPDMNFPGTKTAIRCNSRTEIPGQQEWIDRVNHALSMLKKRELEKIVLAKKSLLQFVEPLDTLSIFRQIRQEYSNSFFFFFQLNPDLTFMGVSPELLYSRRDDRIYSEALAGTRPRGKNTTEDAQFEKELKNDGKEQREHRWVSGEIETNLQDICSEWSCVSREEVIKLAYVQHLQTQFQGFLKTHTTDGQILEVFHPTPAVAGIPRPTALHHIQKLENFDRGWYAGPIGWLSREKTEFAVALRSALMYKKEALIYGGAGIVSGSEPVKEWQEVENKLKNFTNLFTGL